MFISRLLGVLAGVALAGAVAAQDVLLRSDAPTEYVVKKGDTLWDISAMFLEKPWLWPEIWYVNPQVENPHLIYPGDKLYLVWVDGRPMLRKGDGKMGPQIRVEPLGDALPAVPLEYINPFLDRSRAILSRDEIDQAPYIVHMREDRVLGEPGTRIYVRQLPNEEPTGFLMFRPGEELKSFDTGETLGYHITYLGDANLIKPGDPAKVDINSTELEVLIGDRLLEDIDESFPRNFYPHAPEFDVDAHIISVPKGVGQIGTYETVIIDRGEADGMEAGHVLIAYSASKTIKDPVAKQPGPNEPQVTVTIPRERAGLVMIYRVFDRVSYALVMRSELPLHLYDEVGTPD
jgi:hypothetical protein